MVLEARGLDVTPATDDGFYYDFAPPLVEGKPRPFTEEDLPAIEAKMREIIAADKPLRREVWKREDMIARWRAGGEAFQAEWADELTEGAEPTLDGSGGHWHDKCPRAVARRGGNKR